MCVTPPFIILVSFLLNRQPPPFSYPFLPKDLPDVKSSPNFLFISKRFVSPILPTLFSVDQIDLLDVHKQFHLVFLTTRPLPSTFPTTQMIPDLHRGALSKYLQDWGSHYHNLHPGHPLGILIYPELPPRKYYLNYEKIFLLLCILERERERSSYMWFLSRDTHVSLFHW